MNPLDRPHVRHTTTDLNKTYVWIVAHLASRLPAPGCTEEHLPVLQALAEQLMDELHERAWQEDEMRWAKRNVSHDHASSVECLRLLTRVVRCYRLAQEADRRGYKFSAEARENLRLSTIATHELADDFGLDVVRDSRGDWIVDSTEQDVL